MVVVCYFFFFKQKTAYEMRISDWSSDVCSSDLWRDEPRREVDILIIIQFSVKKCGKAQLLEKLIFQLVIELSAIRFSQILLIACIRYRVSFGSNVTCQRSIRIINQRISRTIRDHPYRISYGYRVAFPPRK